MAKLKPDRASARAPKPAAAASVEAARADAPRIYNLFPLLVGPIPAWIAELPRIAAMGFNWVYVNPFFQSGQSGSLYAIRDPSRIDERFRGPSGSDLEQIRSFTEAAEAQGLKVMADLVINHTARDAVLAERRWDIYRHDANGDLLSPGAADATAPGGWRVWEDLAELNYQRPEYRDFLVRHFDEHVAFLQSAGVRGFRCDAAYKVPAEVWSALIRPAKAREPGCRFAAETLGCTPEEAKAVAASGFDYLFNSFAWWDSRAGWALEQREDLRLAAPSIAFPENHDMPRLAAGLEGDPDKVADALAGRYALAAAFSAGVLLPIGFEWGYRKQLHVAFTKPEDRESNTGIDISDRIAAINRLKAETASLNVEGALTRLSSPDAPYLALLRLDSGHRAGAREALLILSNPGPAPVTVPVAPLLTGVGGGFGPFAAAGGDNPYPLGGASVVELAAYKVRFFRAPAVAQAAIKAGPSKPAGEGRVVIESVWPEIDGGRAAVKRVVGEPVEVWADIFTDGHEKVAADILYRAASEKEWRRAPMAFVDNDRWAGRFVPETVGRVLYTVEAWRDRWASYVSEIGKKRAAGQMLASEAAEGVALVEKFARHVKGAGHEALHAFVASLKALDWSGQIDALLDPEAVATVEPYAEREQVSRYPIELPLIVDRLSARYSSWYELFPRSASGDPKRHGNFDDVIARLPYVKDLGFDVLYFPPIHPIGTTNRKGKNNSLTPTKDDVGSTYATGSKDGGHDAIHPELGTFEDFKRLIDAAHNHGLEIALDFAIQCSPDHPWIKEHPEWFDWRPDGTIKFAENPPKKYEDIVNVDFYRPGALPSLWHALYDVVMFWVGHGVKIFRVDNPHTKPIPFWDWMIGEVTARNPEVIFLAEAFTRPKMMKRLAKAGFQQSYTYFTWRNTKAELTEYLTELRGEMGEYYRPNFFANTPDINPFYLQNSGRAGFIVRAALAGTLSSSWGIYSGYELCEAAPLPGREEYLDAEKYEIKAWDFDRPGNIKDFIRKLNWIRRENPALWDFRNVQFLNAWNDSILAYVKLTPAKDNCVMALVNLDPRNRQECDYEVPLWLFGLPDHATIEAEDLLTNQPFTLSGKTHRIALDPADRPVVLWRLIPPAPGAP